MPVIDSQIATTSEAFKANRAAMLAQIDQMRALEAGVRAASNAKRAKFDGRGQMLPRERIAGVLDAGAPWLELSTLAGLGMHDDDGVADLMGGGAIVGIGTVSGVRCLVFASDSAIKGGTVPPMGLKKSLRAQKIAFENKLPYVGLIESGGANLNYQAELFMPGGEGFYNQAKASAAGLPQITVVHGSSTAGGAYIPGMSDYAILVKGNSKVFLAGAPLVKAATGEDADEQELGGADMHTRVSGVGDFLAEDDADGLRMARDIVARLGWDASPGSAGSPGLTGGRADDPALRGRAPLYDPDELAGVVPVDYRKPYDVREVIARLVDGSEYLDFKPGYGPATVCGWADIAGVTVGLIGNNGPIDPDGAAKAGQFIQLCSQAGSPLVFLQNTTGFLVGTAVERAGVVKHGSKMIQAVSNAPVPKITLMIGASFGAGNYAMCGRGFHPRFLFGWPNYRTAVMGGEQAATVLSIVARQKAARAGVEIDANIEAMIKEQENKLSAQINGESTALYATARLWDDGLIDPRDSRDVLALALAVATEGDARTPNTNTFGVGRF